MYKNTRSFQKIVVWRFVGFRLFIFSRNFTPPQCLNSILNEPAFPVVEPREHWNSSSGRDALDVSQPRHLEQLIYPITRLHRPVPELLW